MDLFSKFRRLTLFILVSVSFPKIEIQSCKMIYNFKTSFYESALSLLEHVELKLAIEVSWFSVVRRQHFFKHLLLYLLIYFNQIICTRSSTEIV